MQNRPPQQRAKNYPPNISSIQVKNLHLKATSSTPVLLYLMWIILRNDLYCFWSLSCKTDKITSLDACCYVSLFEFLSSMSTSQLSLQCFLRTLPNKPLLHKSSSQGCLLGKQPQTIYTSRCLRRTTDFMYTV